MTLRQAPALDRDSLVRTQLHVQPPNGWLNDPNGLCRIDGTYHVFYQHNPAGPDHSNIHWGHASSPDLIHWTDEPIALAPAPGTLNEQGCWSGCIVDDGGVPTAVYTAVHDGPHNAVVGLARSDRRLQNWVVDPVGKVGNPDDPSISQVRDPFIFTHQGKRYAVQGAGHPYGSPQLLLYSCDDLNEWTYLGPLLTIDDPIAASVAQANIWECPNLFQIGDSWVLIISLWRQIDAYHQLFGVRYLVGDLIASDGDELGFVARAGGTVDDGDTFYAPQALIESDRVLLWGWSWEGPHRSAAQIQEAGWAGVLTFPRELVLDGDVLVSRPAAELSGLRTELLEPDEDGTIAAAAFEIVGTGPIDLVLSDPATGFREQVVSTSGPGRILVDGSIIEAFGDGPSTTTRHYPTETSRWEINSTADYQVWALGN